VREEVWVSFAPSSLYHVSRVREEMRVLFVPYPLYVGLLSSVSSLDPS
jgi:hypothetical protein